MCRCRSSKSMIFSKGRSLRLRSTGRVTSPIFSSVSWFFLFIFILLEWKRKIGLAVSWDERVSVGVPAWPLNGHCAVQLLTPVERHAQRAAWLLRCDMHSLSEEVVALNACAEGHNSWFAVLSDVFTERQHRRYSAVSNSLLTISCTSMATATWLVPVPRSVRFAWVVRPRRVSVHVVTLVSRSRRSTCTQMGSLGSS